MNRQKPLARRAFLLGSTSFCLGACRGWEGNKQSHRRGVLDDGAGVPVRRSLEAGWRFLRDEVGDSFAVGLDDGAWSAVVVPHTARVESIPLEGGPAVPQWQGTCWYRTRFTLGPEAAQRRVFLDFEGAMNVADVWLDGEHLGQHLGGYLPFGFDISDHATPGKEQLLAVRLENRDNPITGPKPLGQLDFNWYGGLYRRVRLTLKSRLHITDPIRADKPASGGVFVRYSNVTPDAAEVEVQVHVRNDDNSKRDVVVRATLLDADGEVVVEGTSRTVSIERGRETEILQALRVENPALWSPRSPNLYVLRTELVAGDSVVDEETTRIGIRRIDVTASGISINGEPTYLRGTNRHQEYPYVGYATSRAAQYRDAQKIKEAGFDFVRLSHYPHDGAFLDACDELGIAVMDAIPGWQYWNARPEFAALQLDNVRRMVRRDRNHPCVILWEASLNETEMPVEFIDQANQAAHAEYPGDQCFTSGWKVGYDVFLQARQHGGCRGAGARPCLVSEYGDWEYYAGNAGLNQEGWEDLAPDEANSRKLRQHGEKGLLQQATNFQEAHDGNRQTTALADGLWVMFDYLRGYAPDLESSGCMDLFRLPKFSYYFFQSQRDPEERSALAASGPMVFIASHWTADSSPNVRVFSNCEAVELYLNGELIERRSPDADRISTNVLHPPFTFTLSAFEAGLLEAIAYIGEEVVARHEVRTPGPVSQIDLVLDEGAWPFGADGKDQVFARALLRDDAGTVVPEAWESVSFGVTGNAEIVGANPFSSEAGVASVLLQTEAASPRSAVYALAIVSEERAKRILAASAAAGEDPGLFELRFTDDGSEPGTNSSLYEEPVPAERVRAALVVGSVVIATADSDSPKFRLRGSAAPM